MKTFALFGSFMLSLAAAVAAPKTHDETVFLFENRKVVIAVPPGFGFASSKDDHGMLNVKVADRKERAMLQLTFLPDPDARFTSSWNRKELMNENFRDHVPDSVEKAMQFVELDPRTGMGTYCVFTDASLVGKTKLPPGEYLNATTGVKAWPGVVVVFSLVSNDTTSKEYKSLLAVLRDSVDEKAVPSL
jgi:hypothetical protein